MPIGRFEASFDLSATGRLDVALAAGVADSITSNVARTRTADATVVQGLHPRVTAAAFAGWSSLDDAARGDLGSRADERRCGGRLTFTIREGITADLSLRWRDYDPDPGESYRQAIAAILIAVVL